MSVIIVAEIGLNHNGDFNIAKKLISKAKDAGCDYVKFQKRTLELCLTKDDWKKPRESPWGKTYGEYRQHVEFEKSDYDEIDRFCKVLNMRWFASVWDIDAFDFIASYYPDFIKIPSALITDMDLLNKASESEIFKIISTGMSDRNIVYNAVCTLGDVLLKFILHCTSSYPCPLEDINLNAITYLQDNFTIPIGFSNHTSGVSILPAAVALGAEMIEFHVTLDRTMYGTDQASSIEDIARAVRIIRQTEAALGDGVKRIMPSEKLHLKRLRYATPRNHFEGVN